MCSNLYVCEGTISEKLARLPLVTMRFEHNMITGHLKVLNRTSTNTFNYGAEVNRLSGSIPTDHLDTNATINVLDGDANILLIKNVKLIFIFSFTFTCLNSTF